MVGCRGRCGRLEGQEWCPVNEPRNKYVSVADGMNDDQREGANRGIESDPAQIV